MSNDKTIATLNNLIETCKDGELGFKTAAEGLKSVDIKPATIREQLKLSFTFHHQTRDLVQNHPPAGALGQLKRLMEKANEADQKPEKETFGEHRSVRRLPTLVVAASLLVGALALAAFWWRGRTTPPQESAAADPCNSRAASDAIGRKDAAALRAEVARKIGHNRVRWLPPGSIVTQDLRSDRLNVDLDAGGVVTRLRCG